MADLLGGEEFEECKVQVLKEQRRCKSGKKSKKRPVENALEGDDEAFEATLQPGDQLIDESGFDLHPMAGFPWLNPIKHKVQSRKAVPKV